MWKTACWNWKQTWKVSSCMSQCEFIDIFLFWGTFWGQDKNTTSTAYLNVLMLFPMTNSNFYLSFLLETWFCLSSLVNEFNIAEDFIRSFWLVKQSFLPNEPMNFMTWNTRALQDKAKHLTATCSVLVNTETFDRPQVLQWIGRHSSSYTMEKSNKKDKNSTEFKLDPFTIFKFKLSHLISGVFANLSSILFAALHCIVIN